MKVKSKEVAEALGVSTATVSLAIDVYKRQEYRQL